MRILRYPRVAAAVILTANALLLVWSMGDFDRHISIQRIREYFAAFPFFLIILFPTAALFILLPRLSSKARTLGNEIAAGLILAAFVVTMALCAMTVYSISRLEALGGLFYFLGIGVQIILLALLAFITTRTNNA